MTLSTRHKYILSCKFMSLNNSHRYFSGSRWSNNEADPSETQVYWVADNETNAEPHCITCELKSSGDKLCRENSAIFSANFTYFIHKCSGPDVPETTTRQTEVSLVIQFTIWIPNFFNSLFFLLELI